MIFGVIVDSMVFVVDIVIVEVEELVELGELGFEEVYVFVFIVDMVYVRIG